MQRCCQMVRHMVCFSASVVVVAESLASRCDLIGLGRYFDVPTRLLEFHSAFPRQPGQCQRTRTMLEDQRSIDAPSIPCDSCQRARRANAAGLPLSRSKVFQPPARGWGIATSPRAHWFVGIATRS